MNKSMSTVKADAARVSFSALGEGIVWAVLDSGIDGKHPHFRKHGNLEEHGSLKHRPVWRSYTCLWSGDVRVGVPPLEPMMPRAMTQAPVAGSWLLTA